MRLPIIVVCLDSRDVDIYDSLKEAAASIECFDIDETEVFDADGCVVKIVGEKPPASQFVSASTPVELVPTDEKNVEGLRAALIHCLGVLGHKVPEGGTLDELLGALRAHSVAPDDQEQERQDTRETFLYLVLIMAGVGIGSVTYGDFAWRRIFVVVGWALLTAGGVGMLRIRARKRRRRNRV